MIEFTKMHGLGNDFIVIDNTNGLFNAQASHIAELANRRTGVGFDQMLVVEAPSVSGVEFDYRIYNSDGGEVEHCGNGARCFARFVYDKGLTTSTHIKVNTLGGRIELHLLDDGRVTVDMGIPDFEPESLPFDVLAGNRTDQLKRTADGRWSMAVEGHQCVFGVVSLGNPHLTMFVDDVDFDHVEKLGTTLESHARFPARVNVGFMQIDSPKFARLRVFEGNVTENTE